MTADLCKQYVVRPEEPFTRIAESVLDGFAQAAEILDTIYLELRVDPKGLKSGRFVGIEQIGDTSWFGRKLNADPPVTVWYIVDDIDCLVHLVYLLQVPHIQP